MSRNSKLWPYRALCPFCWRKIRISLDGVFCEHVCVDGGGAEKATAVRKADIIAWQLKKQERENEDRGDSGK